MKDNYKAFLSSLQLRQTKSDYSNNRAPGVPVFKKRSVLLVAFLFLAGLVPALAQVGISSTGGTTTGTYTTVNDAFLAINAGTHTGAVTITVTGNTTEPAGGATLNASGAGSASYTAINIAPSGGSFTVSGAATAGLPLIIFNGADNVTINGGDNLTFSNTTVSATAGTSTLKLIGDATSNTFNNVKFLTAATAAAGVTTGAVWISTGTTTGNDNNSFQGCKFTSLSSSSLGSQLIVASGTTTSAALANSGITINNCEFYDYFGAAVNSAAIYAGIGNTQWTITNNKIYQTAARTITTASTVYGIYFVNTTYGENLTVTGNTIGYASNAATGTMTYASGTTAGGFAGITLNYLSSTTTTNTLANNTISDIQWTSTGASTFTGITSASLAGSTTGTVHTITGNTVKNISLITTTGAAVGITAGYVPTTNINNNTVSNIVRTGSGTLFGIQYAGSTTTVTVNNNNVSGLAINSTGNTNGLYGIYTVSSPTIEIITNNTIDGLSSASTSTMVLSGLYNLSTTTGTKTFQGNTVKNLSLPSAGTGSIGAIRAAYIGSNNDISSNIIFNLTGGSTIYGIISGASSAAGTAVTGIYKNKIYGLSSGSATGVVYGIYISAGSTNNIYNNLVGDLSSTAYTSTTAPYIGVSGIYLSGGTTNNLYNNTVYIGNVTSSGTNFTTNGIYASSTPTTVLLQNNLVVNLATPKGNGKAIAYQRGTTTLTNYSASSDKNSFYGTSGLFWNGTTAYTTIADYKTAMATRDQNSFNENPAFASTTGSAAAYLHMTAGIATALESAGITVALSNTDIDGDSRPGPSGSLNGGGSAYDIGADEFDGIPASPTITLNNITPSGNQCTATSRVVTANVNPRGTLTAAPVLAYQVNGGTATNVTMTAGTGTTTTIGTWTATIPAASPANAIVTWSISANNGLASTYTGTSYADAPLTGFTANIVANPAQVCPGGTISLSSFGGTFTAPTYTAPTAVSNPTSDEDLGNVTIKQGTTTVLNNTSALNSLTGTIGTATGTAGSYSNFAAAGTYALNIGQTYTLSLSSLTSGTFYSNAMAVYIDYNHNGSFADSGEAVYVATATTSGPHTETGSFTVPSSVVAGLTKMRVICNEGLVTSSTMTVGYGEIEEYTINLALPFTSYQWSTASDYSNSISTAQNVSSVAVASVPTTYYLKATDANGCMITSSVTVTASASMSGHTITPSTTSTCQGSPITLTQAVTGGCPTLTYAWSVSPANAGTFSNATALSPTFTPTVGGSVTVTCVITDAASTTSTKSATITVTNPQPAATNATALCGTGTTTLTATAGTTGNILSWYTTATGGTLVGTPSVTSSTVTSPTISAATTYYAEEAIVGAGSVNTNTGSGSTTTATAGFTPYTSNYEGQRIQYLFTAAELTAKGLTAGNITNMAFNVTAAGAGTYAQSGFTIKIANVSSTAFSAAYLTGTFTTVYGPVAEPAPAVGTKTYTFAGSGFNWDGSSSILIEICHDNDSTASTCASCYSSNSTVSASTTTFNSVYGKYADNSSLCGTTNGTAITTFTTRPDVTFAGQATTCKGTRVAVVVPYSTAQPFAITANQAVCNAAGTSITVTTGASDYTTVTWTPVTGLYTDAGFSTAYTAGTNTQTVYVKNTAAGTVTYTAAASNASGCSATATSAVTTMPTATVSAASTNFCQTGTPALTLSPATGYGTATIQWQSSTDGTTFTNISGATAATYTAATAINTSTTYKAIIKDSNGNTCQQPTVTINVDSPAITGTTPGTRCGTGTVALAATGSIGTTLKWYAASTGGTALATGGSFTTPSISSTTNYYVDASSGETTANVGPVSPTAQGGTIATQTIAWNVNFTVLSETTLKTVDIFPLTSGQSGVITVRNGSTTSGTVIATINYTTTVSGGTTPQTIAINIPLSAGSYNLYTDTLPSGGVRRNESGAVYPYTSALANITGNGFSTAYFMGLYNWVFGSGCTSSRTPVAATVSPAAALTLDSSAATICGGSSSAVALTSATADYDTYTWSATTGTGTLPTGNVASGWTFSPATTTTYTLNAVNTTNSCANVATYTVTVIPTATATASSTTYCQTGTPTLNLSPATGYGAATIQWQSSADGVTYTDISGATAATYPVTTAITASTTYKAVIKGGNGTICQQPTVTITVNNPLVSGTTPAGRCGTGTVVLGATGSTGTTIKWYAAATGGTALFTGSNFTTPSISATATYYAEASIGTCASTRTGVIATVTPAPALTLNGTTAAICGGSSSSVALTSTAADYDTYTWSATTGTGALPTGNVASGWSFSPASTTTYTLNAGNTASGCVNNLTYVVTVIPTATVSASTTSICQSGIPALTLSPATGYGAATIQWQSSTDGTNFTDISGATAVTYTAATAINANTTYKAIIKDSNGVTCQQPTVAITVNNPLVASSTGATRCGPGTLSLSATGSAGSTLKWYAAATGGTPLATGESFTTPSVSTTTNYYVEASIGQSSYTVGPVSPSSLGTISASNYAIGTYYQLFNVTGNPVTITSVDVYPTATGAASISIANSSGTVLTTANYTSTVTDGVTPVTVYLNYELPVGTGYRIGQGTPINLNRNTTGAVYPYTSANVNVTGNNFLAEYYYYIYNFKYSQGCASNRTPVVATVSPSTQITLSGTAATICGGSSSAATLTAGGSDYDAYTWAATTGTGALPTGNATNGWVFSPATNTTYTLTASNTTSGCTSVATYAVTVLPTATVTSSNTNICASGTPALSLSPATGYGAATIQWQASTDGTNYTDVSGATAVTYTPAAAITASTYYKVVLKDGSGNLCQQPFVLVNVNNAAIVSTVPATRCGDGTLTLSATGTTGNAANPAVATLKWYAAATGGTALFTGSSFTTPVLSTTTTYYVEAGIATCASTRTAVVATVNAAPALTLSAATVTTCAGSPSALITIATGASNYDSYVWSPATDVSGDAATGWAFAPSATATYTLTATNTGSGCTKIVTLAVTALPAPSAITVTPTVTPTGADSCNLEYVKLTASGGLPSASTYCTPVIVGYPGAGGDYINNFSFADITNNGSGDAVSDYTYYSALTANVTPTTYNVTLTAGGTTGTYTQQFRIWIDFNQNGTFEATESVFNTTTATYAPTNATGTITIPASAYNGVTRMRVASRFSSQVAADQSCQIGTTSAGAWGEFEDYNVSITGATDAITFTWAPATGLYTNTALTTAYAGGNTTTVYAAPSGSQLYTATATSANGCTKTATATVVDYVKRYVGTDSSWATPANWFPAGVPQATDCVSIPTGKNVVVSSNTAYSNNLTLGTNANLTVNTGATLSVANVLTVPATGTGLLTIQDNAALIQSASVTTNSNAGTNAKVTKNSHSLFRLDYTMWSSPVSGTQSLYDFSPLTNATRYYEYKYDNDPLTGLPVEQYFGVAPSSTFTAAKGYLIRMPNTDSTTGYNTGDTAIVHQGNFTGKPNNGTVTYPASTVGNKYTAVGNPYPSPINVVDFYTENSGVIENGSAIYFWRKKNSAAVSSYAYITLAGLVANSATTIVGNAATPGYNYGGQDQAGFYAEGNSANYLISQGQGFIVKTKDNPTVTNIVFKNSMRRSAPGTTQGFFKSAGSPVSRLWLNVTGSTTGFSQAAVAYMDDATLGLDYGYDGKKFTDGGSVALYSIAENTNLAIQARPAFEVNDIVPMGFIADATGQYTIALDHFDGLFDGDQNIYIKDKLEGITHNLKNSDYIFNCEAGTFTDRFEVVYTTDALGTDNPVLSANSVIVYKQGTTININSGTAEMTGVTIYDIRGRKIYTQSNINATQTAITGLQIQQEVLIVEVNTVKGKVSKRIIF